MVQVSVASCLTTMPLAGVFTEPLDAMLAEHFRQRTMCDLLDRLTRDISTAQFVPAAQALLSYLQQQLPLHVLDEERDLFTLLRRRTRAADALESAFARLCREHAEEECIRSIVISGLKRLASGAKPEDPAAFFNAARSFAEAQRRHVDYENNSILPLARTRLTPKDLSRLSRRMAARRNLPAPA